MTSDNHQPHGNPADEDVLRSATHELLKRDSVDGPSAGLLKRTLAAVDAGESASVDRPPPATHSRFSRRFLMKSLSTVAGFVLAGGILFFSQSSNTAFAAVIIEQIREAKTLTYDSFAYSKEAADQPIRIKTLINSAGKTRTEMGPADAGAVTINDPAKGDSIVISPVTKSVVRMASKEREGSFDSATGWLESFRTADPEESTPLESMVIDGRQCKGHRMSTAFADGFDVWVDAKSEELVMISYTPRGMEEFVTKIEMKNFVLNEPLDDALFSTAVPVGYTEKTFAVPEPEKDGFVGIMKALKSYSTLVENEFPDDIKNWGALIPQVSKHLGSDIVGPDGQPKQEVMDELMNMASHLGGITPYLMQFDTAEYGYHGEDQQRGDGDTVIFWLREKGQIRAIFDDLKIGVISEEQIPKR